MLPTIKFSLERWKWNKTYEVWVSTEGNVRDKKRNSLTPKMDQHGYLCLWFKGKGFISMHRLVLLTWRPKKDANTLTVDHLNHNKRDNSLRNLEWVTLRENQERAKNDLITSTIEPEEPSVTLNGVRLTLHECAIIAQSVAPAGTHLKDVKSYIKAGLKKGKKKMFGMEIKYA
jgi:hypothetical protein